MNDKLEKISTETPEIGIPEPRLEEPSSLEKEIEKLEAMHVLGQIDLGLENDPFSKIYIELLLEYEKKYGELPKEPFVRNKSEAESILSIKKIPAEINIKSASEKGGAEIELKNKEGRISPLSMFEEPLSI